MFGRKVNNQRIRFCSSIHEEEFDGGTSSSADLLEEDSNVMPNGIDCSIPNPPDGHGRFCRCSEELGG
jgi:hypothetical protein